MLRENTLFGLRDKEAEALDLLRQHEPPEGYYVAYGGGKDSTVILDLVRRSGVKYDAHYNITTVDPPELVYHIRKQADVVCGRPVMSMWELIPKMGMPPTRIMRYCCKYLKERGGAGRTVITGVRAAESIKRRSRSKIETSRDDKTKLFMHLVFDWSTAEVWEYIHARGLGYCSLYDEGFKRLGCICCPMGGWRNQLRDAERWPKYRALYIMAFDRMVERLKSRNGCRWRDGLDVWKWWTSPLTYKRDFEVTSPLFDEDTAS